MYLHFPNCLIFVIFFNSESCLWSVVIGWQQRALYSWNARDSCSPSHVHVVCYTKSTWTLWWKKGLGLAHFMSACIEIRLLTVTSMWFCLTKWHIVTEIGDDNWCTTNLSEQTLKEFKYISSLDPKTGLEKGWLLLTSLFTFCLDSKINDFE